MKNRTSAALLAFFCGGLGIHKFYLNETTAGILYAVFCWSGIPGILAFIDAIILLTMSDDDFNEKYNKEQQPQKFTSKANSAIKTNISNTAETLMTYKKLMDQNVITQEEFNAIKKAVLDL